VTPTRSCGRVRDPRARLHLSLFPDDRPLEIPTGPEPWPPATLRPVGAVAARVPTGLEQAMGATPLLGAIPERTIRELAESGTLRQYRRGTYLFHQGDDSPNVFFLWRGRVEISSLSITGHRQLHTTLDQPQFFGELGVLGQMQRTATAMALEESTVWVVNGETFMDFLTDHPDASRALLRALARQV